MIGRRGGWGGGWGFCYSRSPGWSPRSTVNFYQVCQSRFEVRGFGLIWEHVYSEGLSEVDALIREAATHGYSNHNLDTWPIC